MRAAVEVCSHFFCACHEYYILFGTDFAKKKRAGMGFWFPKPALIFYADICMMAKESTPSLTGHSLVAMLNSKWIGVKVVSNQRLHHLRPLCHNAFLALRLHRRDFEEHNFVMFHHASSSPRSPNNTGFYFPSCFILPRHRIGKWGKIWGNSRAVLNAHQMVVHYILYTPCFPVSNRGYDEKRGMPKASLYNRCSLSSAL